MEFKPHFNNRPEIQPLYGLQTGKINSEEDNPEVLIFPDSDDTPEINPLYAVQFDPEPSNVPHPEPVYGIQFGPTNIPDLPDFPIEPGPKPEPLYAVQFEPVPNLPDVPSEEPEKPVETPDIEKMSKEELIELLKKILAGLLKNE